MMMEKIIIVVIITMKINSLFQPGDFSAASDTVNGTVYNFSVDHSGTDKEDILNIHKYLMKKNNIK